MHRTSIVLTLLVAGSALAGCMGGEDDLEGQAVVEYEGSEPGSASDSVQCDQDGQLTVTAAIEDGGFSVEVSDESGTLYEQTYNGTLDGETQSLDGDPGEWTLTVVRPAGFDGSFAVQLGC